MCVNTSTNTQTKHNLSPRSVSSCYKHCQDQKHTHIKCYEHRPPSVCTSHPYCLSYTSVLPNISHTHTFTHTFHCLSISHRNVLLLKTCLPCARSHRRRRKEHGAPKYIRKKKDFFWFVVMGRCFTVVVQRAVFEYK